MTKTTVWVAIFPFGVHEDLPLGENMRHWNYARKSGRIWVYVEWTWCMVTDCGIKRVGMVEKQKQLWSGVQKTITAEKGYKVQRNFNFKRDPCWNHSLGQSFWLPRKFCLKIRFGACRCIDLYPTEQDLVHETSTRVPLINRTVMLKIINITIYLPLSWWLG